MTNPAHTVAADVAIISAGMAAHRAALRHGINANVVRKWLPKGRGMASTGVATMLPVSVQPAAAVVVVNPKPRSTAMPLMATSNSPTRGHPKFPQAGRPDYDDSGEMAMRAAASLSR